MYEFIYCVRCSRLQTAIYDPKSGDFMPNSPGIGMHVEIKDPDSKPILSRAYNFEGRISFISHAPREHRVHLDIQVGDYTINSGVVTQKDMLSEFQLRRIHLLLGQVEQYREEHFRQTSESTHRLVFWWSLTQTVIVLIMGAWQMKHLKSFFEAKKLV